MTLRGGSSPGSWRLPEEEVARLLGQVLGEFADRHEHVEDIFRRRFEQVKHLSRTRRAAIARTADAHRRLFHARVFAGVGGAVQSVHCAASRPVWSAQGRAAFHSESAGHGRRPHFLHHLPHWARSARNIASRSRRPCRLRRSRSACPMPPTPRDCSPTNWRRRACKMIFAGACWTSCTTISP